MLAHSSPNTGVNAPMHVDHSDIWYYPSDLEDDASDSCMVLAMIEPDADQGFALAFRTPDN
jgi:hypothetical protein